MKDKKFIESTSTRPPSSKEIRLDFTPEDLKAILQGLILSHLIARTDSLLDSIVELVYPRFKKCPKAKEATS